MYNDLCYLGFKIITFIFNTPLLITGLSLLKPKESSGLHCLVFLFYGEGMYGSEIRSQLILNKFLKEQI